MDFQKGEKFVLTTNFICIHWTCSFRQMNMDYSICHALQYKTSGLNHALVIYDIACQYFSAGLNMLNVWSLGSGMNSFWQLASGIWVAMSPAALQGIAWTSSRVLGNKMEKSWRPCGQNSIRCPQVQEQWARLTVQRFMMIICVTPIGRRLSAFVCPRPFSAQKCWLILFSNHTVEETKGCPSWPQWD